MNKKLKEKINESVLSVLPVTGIVLLLSVTVSPLSLETLSLFISGAVMLIVGMGLFSIGTDMAMLPMGEHMGAHIAKSRKLWLVLVLCFIIGTIITIAEPDLTVLANQVPAIANFTIIMTVAVGVGVFLVVAFLRIIFRKKLSHMLLVFYALVFVLAIFTSENFLSVAFDSGGVTTGPVTVPFIVSLGIGLAAVTTGDRGGEESFGLVALCSIGPILAVMILGLLYPDISSTYTPVALPAVGTSRDLLLLFVRKLPHFMKEVALALAPIVIFFAIFQVVKLKLPRRQLERMGVGMVYTYAGLVLFLTGVNVSFMPAGNQIGRMVAQLSYNWILIPIGMAIGFFIVRAEPAVNVVSRQVEEITGGMIARKAMMYAVSVGVAVSIGLAMVRVLTGASIWFFVVPGYAIAMTLMFFVPQTFVAVAFDSGGVASGPMTATFLLPFAMGACEQVGGNVMTDAFGVVAMVAMTPLITIQVMGLVFEIKRKSAAEEATPQEDSPEVIDL